LASLYWNKLSYIFVKGSTSVKNRPRLSKAGHVHVRQVMYMAAMTAVKQNPVIKDFYTQLVSRGKSKKAALCAAMRKLVHICFGVIKHQQPFAVNAA